jgi:hypothetical protein
MMTNKNGDILEPPSFHALSLTLKGKGFHNSSGTRIINFIEATE